jgi:hypothetical protein
VLALLADTDGSRKTLFRIGAISVGLVLASTAAEAKGCIKGAIVGGLAGHYVGRDMLSLGEHRAGRCRNWMPGGAV